MEKSAVEINDHLPLLDTDVGYQTPLVSAGFCELSLCWVIRGCLLTGRLLFGYLAQ